MNRCMTIVEDSVVSHETFKDMPVKQLSSFNDFLTVTFDELYGSSNKYNDLITDEYKIEYLKSKPRDYIIYQALAFYKPKYASFTILERTSTKEGLAKILDISASATIATDITKGKLKYYENPTFYNKQLKLKLHEQLKLKLN